MDDQLQRRADDNRASEPVNWNGVATPLPDSSIVYLARHRANDTNTWIELKTEEELADAHRSPNEIELRTVFTVPVAELARSPVSIVMRARVALDGLERRIAKAERRIDDRRPSEPLQWDDCPDLLEMKAAANELQSAAERASTSSLHFMQVRTEDVAAAVSYTKYLANLAGTVQAGRCRAQGGDTNEEAAGVASQSQAVPSELASLRTYEPMIETAFGGEEVATMSESEDGEYVKLSDVQSLFSHSAATGKVPEGWKLVPVEPTDAMYNAACRAYYAWLFTTSEQADWTHRDTYRAMLTASPAAPLAAAVPAEEASEDDGWAIADPAGVVTRLRKATQTLLDAALQYEAYNEDSVLSKATSEADEALAACVGYVPFHGPAEPAPIPKHNCATCKDTGIVYTGPLGDPPEQCDACFDQEPAPIQSSALTDEQVEAIAGEHDPVGAIERVNLARLSKPTAQGTASDVYEHGPEGMPRVERMPYAVLDCLIDRSMFRYIASSLEGEDRDRLYALMHDTANETLARIPSWGSQSPAQVTGEPASIDTPEFRKALCAVFGVKDIIYAKALPALVAVINRHIAAQATAGCDAQQWISVDDQMPPMDVEVLVFAPNGDDPRIEMDTWGELYEAPVSFSSATICTGEGWANNEFEEITHWMPLPAAPHAAEQSSGGAK